MILQARTRAARRSSGAATLVSFAGASLLIVACAGVSTTSNTVSPTASAAATMMAPLPEVMTAASSAAPSPDPRVGLKGGWFDAAQATWNMRVVSMSKPSAAFMNPVRPTDGDLKSSDLAFVGTTVFQGNYSGWQAWDVSNPRAPRVVQSYVCPGQQSDVSVHKNLLFVSHESTSGRIDCGIQGVTGPSSPERARGVRVYDISNLASPKRLTMVQTCRGSHTHSMLTDPNDKENIYIYVSGSSGIRPAAELAGCSSGSVAENPNTASFRLEVIQVPLANPAQARIVSSPRVFNDLTSAPGRSGGRGGRGGAGGAAAGGGSGAGAAGAAGATGGAGAGAAGAAGAATPPTGRGGGGGGGPTQCHDITTYPAVGLAGGACSGYGLLLDIRDPKNPRRIAAVTDTNMSTWHSVTFSNDGKKIIFSDEWGGGTGARCRATDKMEWGANSIYTIGANNQLTPMSYYKMPAAQTEFENCVSHNGSLIPVPGRDIMVQSWYQGGISVFDWTDPLKPKEIAFFDRGPMNPDTLTAGGHWSAYWYNGLIYGSEEFRGLDIFELTPSAFLSVNEIEAAKSVRMEQFNPQDQPKIVWPPSFSVARSYLDQLARGNGMPRDRATAVAGELVAAEKLSGQGRRDALTRLATQLDGEAGRANDSARVRMMATAIRELAAAQR